VSIPVYICERCGDGFVLPDATAPKPDHDNTQCVPGAYQLDDAAFRILLDLRPTARAH